MKLKSGDKVIAITGKDKGKKGKVLQVFKANDKASIEGINLAIKHMHPRKQGEKGQKVEFPAPINMSNLMLLCPKCNRSTRIKYKFLESNKGKKVRVCSKCKELID